ncbi:MAG: lanthionine synthetase C family protein [Bacteroidota bacterium]
MIDLRQKMKTLILEKLIQIESELSRYKGSRLSLYGGTTGIAMFYANLYELTGDSSYLEKCESLIVFTIEKLSKVEISHRFSDGISGIAWGIDYLINKEFIEDDGEDIFELLDDYIYDSARLDLKVGNYDFLHGGMGAVLYALQRLKSNKSMSFLKDFINEISRIKEEDRFGFKWEDPFFLKEKYSYSKTYNLGMAHGIPSILEVLRRIYSKHLFEEETSRLVHGGLSWIEHCKLNTPESPSIYPNCVLDKIGQSDGPSRMAWCYGDLSLAILFWKCGETYKKENWKHEGMNLMTNSVKRSDPLQNKYYDAGICHGTAGIAHLFKRFHNATQRNEFNQRSIFWINETLNQSRHKSGLAGYRLYSRTEKNDVVYHRWKNSHFFLEGIAGIGMVLISHLNNKTDWDNCLLI